jgi:Uma2 family endonuclease
MGGTGHAPLMQLVLLDEQTELDLDRLQGLWTDEQYLRLSLQTNRQMEFTDGFIEFLPPVTCTHQGISAWILLYLFPLIQQRSGALYFGPLCVCIRPGKYRQPDLLLLLNRDDPRNQHDFWLGADLVVEIVSPDNPERDTRVKRVDYAEGGIPEYWIVNPLTESITVLRLEGGQYVEHGVFRRGDQATSALLPEVAIPVDAVFDAN